MDLYDFSLDKLVQKVGAQGLDSLVQPTFGNLDLGDNVSLTSSISITTSNTSVQVGNTFEVDIKIDTKGTRIQSFDVIIDFDPARLTVIDSDTSTAGTQIQFLDSIFEVVANGNNVSLSNGRITLKAATPTGIAYQITNRTVAKVRFQSQSAGTTVIRTVSGSGGSQLVNSRGVSIATVINDLTISSTTQVGGGDNGGGQTPPGNGGQPTTPTNPGTETPPIIPDTNLEGLINATPLIIGIVLVVLGVLLSRATAPNKQDN